jgi:hypothetical protein
MYLIVERRTHDMSRKNDAPNTYGTVTVYAWLVEIGL